MNNWMEEFIRQGERELMREYKKKSCSTCKHLRTLFAHPSNKDFGKGSILEGIGFACLNPEVTEGIGAIYFESDKGICECHEKCKC